MTATSRERFDLIVVGLGAMGSAALFHAAKGGVRALGIDRFDPPHAQGSSHAETRITRLAIGEGPEYLPFVARSHEIWRELEALGDQQLLYQPGGYVLSLPNPTSTDRWGDFVTATAEVAAGAGIGYELRTAEAFARHLPNVSLRGGELIGFEPTGGVVLSEAAVALQLKEAVGHGVQKLVNTVVSSVEPSAGHVVVTTEDGATFVADKVIVTTGAWFGDLAPAADAAHTSVTRQVVHWFEVDDPEVFSAERFPFLLWPADTIEDYLGVFPMVPGGVPGFKILGEQFTETTDPASVDRTVSASEIRDFYDRLVADRFVGVKPTVVKAEVCLYTNTTDDDFLIDTHPESDRVLYASPCSGHGFKHSTALGEAMAQVMTTGESTLDLTPFRRDRLATAR